MEVTRLGCLLLTLREERRLSLKAAASQALMSSTYLWQIEKGVRTPSAEILKRVALAYEIDVEGLFRAAGYLDEPAFAATVFGQVARLLQDGQLAYILQGWERLSIANRKQIFALMQFFEHKENLKND